MLVQKSFCYAGRISNNICIGTHACKLNVSAKENFLEFQPVCIFSCILTLFIMLIKPPTT